MLQQLLLRSSPPALRRPGWRPLHIYVNLTMEQVQASPGIDLHKPVSREHEMENLGPYELPFMRRSGCMGLMDDPRGLVEAQQNVSITETKGEPPDTHLRSTHEVARYQVKPIDEEIRHIMATRATLPQSDERQCLSHESSRKAHFP
jgi:hypothetical protein